MMYGLINTKTEKERDKYRKALEVIADLCKDTASKSAFNHHEHLLAKIYRLADDVIKEYDNKNIPPPPPLPPPKRLIREDIQIGDKKGPDKKERSE